MGLDYNAGMLAVARALRPPSASLEWLEGSALYLPFDEASFDLVLCQLGLQFFAARPVALREMLRVLVPRGRLALSVYGPIEHTPAADAFAEALDQCLGQGASKTKRAEHIFTQAREVQALLTDAGFDGVNVSIVTKWITFPSLLDYVRFQLIATPMASLLADRCQAEREGTMRAIASHARALLDPNLLDGGRLSSPQEAFVATALRAS